VEFLEYITDGVIWHIAVDEKKRAKGNEACEK
jgi:hypothetical protein